MDLVKPQERLAAKIAGFSNLLTFTVVVAANFGIYNQLQVRGNITQTTQNIIEHPVLFRTGVAMDILYGIGFICMTVMLYEALKSTNQKLGLLAAGWHFVYACVWIVVTIHVFDVFTLLDKSSLQNLPLLESSVKSFMSSRNGRYYGGLPFYALGTAAFSYLMIKSGLVSKPLATAGVIASLWCLICSLLHIIVPNFSQFINLWAYDIAMALTQIAISFSLILKK